MTSKEIFGRIDFSTSCGLFPWGDPSEYVHSVIGRIILYSEIGEESQAGEITLRIVLATAAINQHENLYDVCDADSAILEAAYAVLFNENGDTKEDLDIEPGWNNLVLLENVEVDPEHRQTTLVIQAIDTALAMFASEGLVVAVEEGLDLSIEQWKHLGFMRIAGTGFVFRDQLKVNPYRDKEPQ